MPPIKIAIIGFGKIARDQHAPSIEETDGLELVATVSRQGHAPEDVATFLRAESLKWGEVIKLANVKLE